MSNPVCCRCCMWLPVLVSPPHMQMAGAMNASQSPTPDTCMANEDPKTTREDCQLIGSGLVGVVREVRALISGRFP
jgi:hypothetical protein